jgi:Aerotolerance regulator N-terminal
LIGFATPLWLAAFALVPLIRWLHRRGDSGPPIPVASVTLWRAARAPTRESARRSRTYDPAWIRRAAFVCALAIALSGPQIRHPATSVVVWIDHSLSMQAREGEATRLNLALDALDGALAERGPAHLTLRSLANPARVWRSLEEARRWLSAGTRAPEEPDPPPAAALPTTSEHWIVTDGADAALNAWMAHSPIARVIRVGNVSENAAVLAIGTRFSISAPGRIAVQVRLFNAGEEPVSRRVSLAAAGHELAATRIELPAGKITIWQTEVERPDTDMLVRLEPRDALPLDDELAIAQTQYRLRTVRVDAQCGERVRTAIDANPGLEIAADSVHPDIAFACGPAHGLEPVPAIVVEVPTDATAAPAAARWAWSLPRRVQPPIESAGARSAPLPQTVRAGDRVLLTIGGDAVIVRRAASPARIDVGLDLADPGLASRDEFVLLIADLAEALTDEKILDRIGSNERPLAASSIRPLLQEAMTTTPTVARGQRVETFTRQVLVVALLLIGWDLVRRFVRWSARSGSAAVR